MALMADRNDARTSSHPQWKRERMPPTDAAGPQVVTVAAVDDAGAEEGRGFADFGDEAESVSVAGQFLKLTFARFPFFAMREG